MRECGVLLPISSLPSKYGIGCFSKEAYEFVDFLRDADRNAGRSFRWDRPVMGILHTSRFLRLRGIPILSILEDW